MTATQEATPAATLDVASFAPGDLTRLVEILTVLARHGAVVVARHGTTIVVRPRAAGGRAVAVALRRSFADLGPTFVKLGQLVASSPGLFPAVLSEECRRLLDHAPAVPYDRIRLTVTRSLGAPVEVLFDDLDPTPVAAASIAQVHRGRLRDGSDVAVKVRRPRLHRRIDRDVRLLRVLAVALDGSGALGRAANPVAVIDDFGSTLVGELDFRREAAAMASFAANLAGSAERTRVTVPAVVDGMASERVVVMSYIDGVPIDDPALRERGHDLEAALLAAVRVWLEGVLVHGLFHGDVHAGNLFVTPDGRVAFLDFGITGALPATVRDLLRELLPAVLVGRDFERAVHAIVALGATTRDIDTRGAATDIDALVTPLLSRPLGEIVYSELLESVLRVATRHGIRLPRELVLVVKQLLYFERYAKAIAPNRPILADPALLAIVAGA